MTGRILGKIYIGLVLLFLYAPIGVLVALSFNSSKSRVIWGGFTLKWYVTLFESSAIMSAFGTTMALAVLSAAAACIIGLTASLGIYSMRKRGFKVMMFFTNIPSVWAVSLS